MTQQTGWFVAEMMKVNLNGCYVSSMASLCDWVPCT